MVSAEAFQVPEDYYSTLNEAIKASKEQTTMELDVRTRLYLLEFNKMTKIDMGDNIPCVTIE